MNQSSGSVPPPAPSFPQDTSPTLEPPAVRQILGRFIKRHLRIIADRKCRVRVLPNTHRNRRTTSQKGDRVMPNGEIEIEWADMLKLTAPASPSERAPPPASQCLRSGECSPPPASQFDLPEQAQEELGWRSVPESEPCVLESSYEEYGGKQAWPTHGKFMPIN